MKKLIYIPIVHNKADLGSLGSQLSLEGERKYGAIAWQNHLEQVDRSWDEIEIEISQLVKRRSFKKIKIYQDGLPVVDGIGLEIVKDAAGKGSKNYAIIDRLITLGAKLEIAESKEFLLKEYHLLTGISKAETPEKQLEAYLEYQETAPVLLNNRDQHIANQINLTLENGEMGIAFFGAAHSIVPKLDKKIKIILINLFKDDISLNLTSSK